MLQRIVFLFFFILPFQWALSPVPGIDLALARVLSMLIFFVWVFSSVFKKRLMLPDGLSSFLASSFLFISALSFLWAGNADFSVRKIAFLFSFFPSFFVLTSFFKENIKRVQTTLSFFIYGSVIAAAVSLVQFFSQFIFGVEKVFSFWTGSILPFFLGSAFGDSVAAYPSLLVNISGKTLLRATGFFPDPHMFSFYMGISILLTLGMFFSQRERKWGYAFWILLVADLLAFSRGGYLGLCAGVTFFLFTFFYQKGLGVRGLLTGAGIFGIIFLTAWSPIGARFGSTFSTEDGSNKERIRLWEEALGHISERPFLGVGLGNYPLLVKPSAGYREPIYVHNLYLDIAVEAGLLGLSFFVALLWLAGWRLWRKWEKTHDTLSLGTLGALLVFSTHAFFDTPLFSVHALPALLLLLAGGVS